MSQPLADIFFKLEDPWALLLLLGLPVIYLLKKRFSNQSAVRFSSIARLKAAPSSPMLALRNIVPILRFIVLVMIIISLARPQTGSKSTLVNTEVTDIVLVLDTSGSMNGLDFELNGKRVNRLAVVKSVVETFIKNRVTDRIGMVVFGTNAYTQCPLTVDYGVLLSFLEMSEIGMAGEGTAVGDALATAVTRLKDSAAKSKVIILLTDGRNNAGKITPKTAAEIAKTYGIKTYTIGVGTTGPVPFLVDSFWGKQYTYQNVDLDDETLREIAAVTGGRYFHAQDTKGLQDVYREIDSLEKTDVQIKEYMEYNEQFRAFSLIAILLLVGEIILSATRFRKIP